MTIRTTIHIAPPLTHDFTLLVTTGTQKLCVTCGLCSNVDCTKFCYDLSIFSS